MLVIASFINSNVLAASCVDALMAKPRSKSGIDAVSEKIKQQQEINRINKTSKL